MDDQNLPQNSDTNPFDQYYSDNSQQEEHQPPRQAPAHLNINNQQQPVNPQPPMSPKSPTPAYRPGEATPAQPVHNNIPQIQQEQVIDETENNPQELINQALVEQSQETGTQLPTYESSEQSLTPPQPQIKEPEVMPSPEPTDQIENIPPQQQTQTIPETLQPITPDPAPIFKQPVDTQPQTASKIDNSGLPPTRKQMTIRKIIIGVFLFILMTVVGAAAMVFASSAMGNSTNPLQNILLNLPFVPKSKYTIISGILANDAVINSYDYSYTLNLNFESQSFGDPQVGSMLFTAKGAAFFDEQGLFTESSSKLDFNSNASFWSGSMSVNTVSNKNAVYFQLGGTSGAFSPYSQYLPPVDQWYLVDFSSPENIDIEDIIIKDSQPLNYSQTQLKAILEAVQSIDEIEDAIELKNEVTLANGSEAYRVIFTPTTDMLLDIVNALALANDETLTESERTTFKNIIDNFEVLAIEVWAEKETYLVNKLQIDFTYVLNSEEFTPLFGNSSSPIVAGASKVLAEEEYQDVITGSITADYSNYNNATPIKIPSDAIPIDEYLENIDPALYGFSLDPEEELVRVNNAKIKSDINQIGQALEAHATQNGGEYPETLDGLVSTLYLQSIPTLPETRDLYCDNSINYLRSDDAKYAAVWIDLEPCSANPSEQLPIYFIYKTSCKVTFEQEGVIPTKNSLLDSC